MSQKMAPSSSGYFSDHHYGSTSETPPINNVPPPPPHILRPTLVNSNSSRQRSSSMNSLTSNHSAITSSSNSNLHPTSTLPPTQSSTVRSLSIISLESPRNSIVSIDENLIRPTRNNSTASLVSLTAPPPHQHQYQQSPSQQQLQQSTTAFINNPTTLSQIHHNVSTALIESPRLRTSINTSAILSDDDSEFEVAVPIAPPPITSRSILKPIFRLKKSTDQLFNLKRDFKFKYDDYTQINRIPTTPSSPSTITTTTHTGILQGTSPTSLITSSSLHSALKSLQDSTPSPLSLEKEKQKEKINNDSITSAKKKKSSTLIQHSILKKKSIYSKDLQNEISNSSPSESQRSLETKFITNRPPPSFDDNDTRIISDEPVMKTLKEQNQLIHKLNRKWNKGVHFERDKDKSLKLSVSPTPPPPVSSSTTRKRSRDALFESEDDTNYDSYDNYDE
ncbi:uncharacterized protein RJT21DRAFT_116762 [Scheffersomyces amazonensis]|uniref:uncharacterized protein n=1 Tax=Scheffersomyces amazonensis TaxID=1078765 RepID=UPI00315C8F47